MNKSTAVVTDTKPVVVRVRVMGKKPVSSLEKSVDSLDKPVNSLEKPILTASRS